MKGAVQHRQTPWSVRPETLATLRSLASNDLLAESAEGNVARQQAALRPPLVATGGVAVIPLRGLITPRPTLFSILFGGGGGLVSWREAFRDALSNDDIAAVLIDVDSPGGSTDLVAETGEEIRAARGTKPIVAIANTWAASAAYWIASQADELVVTPSGEVGSIGVFALHEEFSKMEERLGITTTLIRAGRYKAEANPYEPLTEEARDAIQATVDEFYEMFVTAVAKGRDASVGDVRNGYGEGRMVTASRAVELGMADRVATFEDTVARLAGGTRRGRGAPDARVEDHPPALPVETAPPTGAHADDEPPADDEQRRMSDEDCGRLASLLFG